MIIILKLIHIIAATFWVGSNMFMALFLYPTGKKSGEEGNKFLSNLPKTNKFPILMSIMSMLTIISGFGLIAIISGGFQISFFTTVQGIGLASGGILAILGFLHGFFVIKPCGEKLAEIGKNIALNKVKKNDNIKNEIENLNYKIASSTNFECSILVIALVLMIISKYL